MSEIQNSLNIKVDTMSYVTEQTLTNTVIEIINQNQESKDFIDKYTDGGMLHIRGSNLESTIWSVVENKVYERYLHTDEVVLLEFCDKRVIENLEKCSDFDSKFEAIVLSSYNTFLSILLKSMDYRQVYICA